MHPDLQGERYFVAEVQLGVWPLRSTRTGCSLRIGSLDWGAQIELRGFLIDFNILHSHEILRNLLLLQFTFRP